MQQNEIIEKYRNEFLEYRKIAVPLFDKYLSENRKLYDRTYCFLYDFYIITSFILDKKILPEEPKLAPIKNLYCKSALTLYSIYICLLNGIITDASALLRNLFDNFVTVKLILQSDTEDRLRLYDNFRFVEQWNHIKARKVLLEKGLISQSHFDEVLPSNRIEEVERNYFAVKDDYHPRRPYSWHWKIFKDEIPRNNNRSLFFLCKKLNLELDYTQIFSTFSIYVHNSPLIENLIGNNETITPVPVFNSLITSLGFFCIGL